MRQYTTACGGKVVIPHKCEEHLRAHPEVHGVLQEAIGKLLLPTDNSFLSTEIEMGRVVGRSGRVTTSPITPGEKVLFAQRIGRAKPSRVVVEEGEETSKVSVSAFPAQKVTDTYILVTAWVGSFALREPWDPMIKTTEEYRRSVDFWCREALVYSPEVMGKIFESSWEEILST